MINIKELLRNGIFWTFHAKKEMKEENITMEDIKQVLAEGIARKEFCKHNDKSRAWNNTIPYAVISKRLNLTVIVCESFEKGILVKTVFHGLPKKLETNPFKQRRF